MAEVQTKREMDWKVSMDEASMDDVDALLFLLKVPEDPSFIMHGSTDKKIDKHRKIWFTQVGIRIEMLLDSVWGKEINSQEELDFEVEQDHKKKLEIQRKIKNGEISTTKPKGHRKGEVIDWNNEVPPEFPEFYEKIETLDDVVKVVRYWREPEFGDRDRLVWGEDVDAGNRAIRTTLGKLEEEFGVKIME